MGIRLGDEIDDYCIRCKRLTNHSVVSIVADEAAKVRCRSCYGDHDYRREIAPPTKKELQQAALAAQAANGEAPAPPPPAAKKATAKKTAKH